MSAPAFYSLGRPGAVDVERAVSLGALPPCALTIERTRALIEAMSFGDALLEFVAYGNEDAEYGAVCRAELARRRQLEADDDAHRCDR